MKVLSVVSLIASVSAQTADIPTTTQDVGTFFAQAQALGLFGDIDFVNMMDHGCHCKRLGHTTGTRGQPIDELDHACREFYTSRTCLKITGGSCPGGKYPADKYTVQLTGTGTFGADIDFHCALNTDPCLRDICRTDYYHISKLFVTGLGNTGTNWVKDAECIRTPRATQEEHYCEGDSPHQVVVNEPPPTPTESPVHPVNPGCPERDTRVSQNRCGTNQNGHKQLFIGEWSFRDRLPVDGMTWWSIDNTIRPDELVHVDKFEKLMHVPESDYFQNGYNALFVWNEFEDKLEILGKHSTGERGAEHWLVDRSGATSQLPDMLRHASLSGAINAPTVGTLLIGGQSGGHNVDQVFKPPTWNDVLPFPDLTHHREYHYATYYCGTVYITGGVYPADTDFAAENIPMMEKSDISSLSYTNTPMANMGWSAVGPEKITVHNQWQRIIAQVISYLDTDYLFVPPQNSMAPYNKARLVNLADGATQEIEMDKGYIGSAWYYIDNSNMILMGGRNGGGATHIYFDPNGDFQYCVLGNGYTPAELTGAGYPFGWLTV